MQPESAENQNSQVPLESQIRGIAILTETGYQVNEGQGALVNRNSLIFTVGRTISLIGDGFYLGTLFLWITFLTAENAKTPQQQAIAAATITAISAGTLAAQYLANVLVAPFAGVFIDRWNRRTTMIVSDFVQAALALLPLGVFFVSRDLFVFSIYATYFLLTSASTFFKDSQNGVLQVIVARKLFPQAISVLSILTGIGGIVSSLIAPAFFLAVGPVIAILFNAASFVVSAISLILMRIPRGAVYPRAYQQTSDAPASVHLGKALLEILKDMWRGLRFVTSVRALLAITIMSIVASVGLAAFNAVAIGFALTNLHLDPRNEFELLGVFTAVAGLGAVLGSLLTGVLARKISVKILAVAGIFGLGLFDIIGSSSTTIIVGMIFYCILAAFDNIFLVAYGALILKVTPNALIGRVSGVISPLVALAGFITTIVVSILATVFNPQVNPRTPFPNFAVFFIDLFIGCGLVILLGSLVGALLLRNTKEEMIVVGSLTGTPGIAVTGVSATLE